MISKSRYSLIAVIMLVLLGFGFQNQAKGQVGLDGLFCPAVDFNNGWLDIGVAPHFTNRVNFSGALIGTLENVNGAAVAGMDWMHVNFTDLEQPTPTNEVGSQAVTWWSQMNGRDTFVQVTNSDSEHIGFTTCNNISGSTAVHVRIVDESCNEIRDFCDCYTPGDTHVYDLGDLVTNDGVTINTANLQGHEGFLTVTAVDECPSPNVAVEQNTLAVTVQVDNSDGIDSYGFNANHRWAVCDNIPVLSQVNLIGNGSFQLGVLGPWSVQQGNSGVIDSSGIAPAVNPPACQGPDCDDPGADQFMAFAASSSDDPNGFYGENSPLQSAANLLQTNSLIGQGFETNVTVVQSNAFTPLGDPDATSNTGLVAYALSFLAQSDLGCDNYAMVCSVNITDPLIPTFEDCNCYNTTGNGTSPTGGPCTDVGAVGGGPHNISPFDFEGGRSSFIINDTVSVPTDGSTYVVQYITGQIDGGCANAADPNNTTGALVDNFRNVEQRETFEFCDGHLTGAINAFLTDFVPSKFAGQFNKIDDNTAGGDAILINFRDEYSPEYKAIGALVDGSVTIWDDFETPLSCGEFTACFYRLGIDESIGNSDGFQPTNTTGPITSPPPVTPTVQPTTTPPTQRPNRGGGGSCAISGSPVQLGTAFANVLIPLVPVAFAFGVGAARRRRNRKNGKKNK